MAHGRRCGQCAALTGARRHAACSPPATSHPRRAYADGKSHSPQPSCSDSRAAVVWPHVLRCASLWNRRLSPAPMHSPAAVSGPGSKGCAASFEMFSPMLLQTSFIVPGADRSGEGEWTQPPWLESATACGAGEPEVVLYIRSAEPWAIRALAPKGQGSGCPFGCVPQSPQLLSGAGRSN